MSAFEHDWWKMRWWQVGPVLEAMEEVILGLTRTLDGRVYVALGRGLWDFTAKEIFDYVESLQEGKESQVRLPSAVRSLFCCFPDQYMCPLGVSRG